MKSLGGVKSFNNRNGDVMPKDGDYNAYMVGAVPDTRTINGKQLNQNITLTKDDIEGLDSITTPDLSGYVPTSRKVNGKALSSDISISASDVSAVPTSRTVNGKALSSNITLSASDVNAVPTFRMINGKNLVSDVSLTADDIPLLVGLLVSQKSFTPIYQGTPVIAKRGSEIFNDYAEREYDTNGNAINGNIATGYYSHAEGNATTATGNRSHAEGSATTASGEFSHAEGGGTLAEGVYSHAEGNATTASGVVTHSEGYGTIARGGYSHAEGFRSEATGSYSHAGCFHTVAKGRCQTVIGEYNAESTSDADYFIIGGGGNISTRASCFRVNTLGVFASGAYNSSGADYAELFEWLDGNVNDEDRVGLFVTLDGEYIRIAEPSDRIILGIVSGNPSIVGDVHDDQWQGMYLYDIYGRPLFEDVQVPDETIEEPDPEDPTKTITRILIPAHTERRQKINPDYDNTQTYIPRTQRKEWACVGMMGKLVVRDDGTCEVNGYACVGEGGKATKSESETKYYVMARINEDHVRILIL